MCIIFLSYSCERFERLPCCLVTRYDLRKFKLSLDVIFLRDHKLRLEKRATRLGA
jgi:hypothetical protein